jgi:hypothetical protein
MTELDEFIPGEAAALIAEFGKVIGYTQREPGEYDTATSMAAPADDPKDIMAVVEPYKAGQSMAAGLVEIGDLKVTAAATSFDQFAKEPSTGDICFIDTSPFNVVGVNITYSGELKALYEFHVRAG